MTAIDYSLQGCLFSLSHAHPSTCTHILGVIFLEPKHRAITHLHLSASASDYLPGFLISLIGSPENCSFISAGVPATLIPLQGKDIFCFSPSNRRIGVISEATPDLQSMPWGSIFALQTPERMSRRRSAMCCVLMAQLGLVEPRPALPSLLRSVCKPETKFP